MEAALSALPSVEAAAVAPRTPNKGGEKELVGYVVPRPAWGGDYGAEELEGGDEVDEDEEDEDSLASSESEDEEMEEANQDEF